MVENNKVKGWSRWLIPFTGMFSMVTYVYFFIVFIWFSVWLLGENMIPKSMMHLFPCGTIEDAPRSNSIHYYTENVYLTNFILTLLFTVHHSVLARPSVKHYFGEASEGEISIYRSLYVLTATAKLHMTMLQWQPIRAEPLWVLHSQHALYWPVMMQYIVGVVWLLTSTFAIDHFGLFGITQGTGFNMYEAMGMNSNEELITRLHYGLSRHPIMFGFFIMFWSTPKMTMTRFFFALLWTLYIVYAVLCLEEPDLIKHHADEYEQYRKTTPTFCPFASFTRTKTSGKNKSN